MSFISEERVKELIVKTSNLPLVKVDRAEYLVKEFYKDYSNIFNDILEKNPKIANVSIDIIKQKAISAINYETNKATAISFAAGIPGGLAMVGTIPADLFQFVGHALRIIQKLAYLFGMPGFSNNENLTDDERNMRLVYLGVMFGDPKSIEILKDICKYVSETELNEVPNISPITVLASGAEANLLKIIGTKLTKTITGFSTAKFLPIIGGVVSGSLTLMSLKSMSNRLLDILLEHRA